ncbi:drug/metabolite transporter (DMT)-like permease [Streptosporangium becharense]|uniref:Drug/metabolite transporter (DMT)-like permease n=1 Tax=Streptosporangium becharense TaxID=1816182 RepID=A0A7W9IDX1_9ACTN|nr:DMT family transporter [Streptosporangium becharense]MBB2915561.1 drug/metabolite transporter (DMT)-like permease [Streptosporangium becharense]MBB5818912.1 drug/metabolite transporter (DMT)-like permease [Streptosporangium becharense]
MTTVAAVTRRGVVATLVSAAAFGLMPVFAFYAYGTGMSVTTLLAARFAIAAAVFLAWLGVRGRLVRLTGRQWAILALLGGVMYAAQSLLYFTAVERISPALAALLLYLYPGLVSVLSALVERTRPGWSTVGPILVSLAGLALVVGRVEADLDVIGMLAAVGAAVAYACYIVLGSRVSAALSPAVTTGYLSMFATGSFVVLGLVTGGLDLGFAAVGWAWAATVALVSTVLAIVLFFVGATALGPVRASLLSMFEPVVAVVATWLLLGGSLTAAQLAGGAVVLAGAAWGVLAAADRTGTPEPAGPASKAGRAVPTADG